jgi:hypothetical protein
MVVAPNMDIMKKARQLQVHPFMSGREREGMLYIYLYKRELLSPQ